jgi:chorismate synthase
MSYNTFGKHFRFTTYGESHGPGIGVVVDGCPAGLEIDLAALSYDLRRRRPGQSALTTERNEPDACTITSGVIDGLSTGAPINIIIPNTNTKSKDYDNLKELFRPSHADYTYQIKYGIRDHRGGGRSSARETACRVAAGGIAKQLLAQSGIDVMAYTHQIGPVQMNSLKKISKDEIEQSMVRCPDVQASASMEAHILKCKEEGDTCGGVIQCQVIGVPVGLGSPLYDKLEARLAYAVMSINACVGFEMGVGFQSVTMKGSEYNDEFMKDENGTVITKTNHGGGVQGGISNGMTVLFNSAFKPVSSIKKSQSTLTKNKDQVDFAVSGRHDPCVVPRAVPIVESMAALVIADFMLARRLDTV